MAIAYAESKTTSSAKVKVLIAGLFGAVIATLVVAAGFWHSAPLLGWDTAALVYLFWMWLTIWPMDGELTGHFAVREDPSRTASDVVVTAASIFSLVAVGLILLQSGNNHGALQLLQVALAVVSVIVSWMMVHTLFTLRYAELYYYGPVGGIDFGKTEQPSYKDFAYVAFTMGMTFQTSDTSIQTSEIRQTALRHALLAYVFGTVILASTINLVAGLSK
jgi:uncharacterized membrane protein